MAALSKLPDSIASAVKFFRNKAPALARVREKAEMAAGRTKDAALISAGAVSVGAAKAFIGKPELRGHIRVGTFAADLDGLVPALITVGGIADGFGQYSDDAVLFGAGALAPWLSEMAHLRIAAARTSASGRAASGGSVSGTDPYSIDTEGLFDPEIVG